MQESALPWVEKYRPRTIDELCISPATEALIRSVSGQSCLPHLFFSGPPGTGKTSTAWVIAHSFFENNDDLVSSRVLELNASDDRGIESIRGIVKAFASSTNVVQQILSPELSKHPKSKYRLVFLDECDAITHDGQAMLRRVMEKYSATCRFFLICNNKSKMIPAILSRCRVTTFGAMDDQYLCKCLIRIVKGENLDISKDALIALVETSNGDARRAINNLSSLVTSGAPLDNQVDQVYRSVQRCSPLALQANLENLLSHTYAFSNKLAIVDQWIASGINVSYCIHDIISYLLQILPTSVICSVVPLLAKIETLLMLGASTKITCMRIAICLDKIGRDIV